MSKVCLVGTNKWTVVRTKIERGVRLESYGFEYQPREPKNKSVYKKMIFKVLIKDLRLVGGDEVKLKEDK